MTLHTGRNVMRGWLLFSAAIHLAVLLVIQIPEPASEAGNGADQVRIQVSRLATRAVTPERRETKASTPPAIERTQAESPTRETTPVAPRSTVLPAEQPPARQPSTRDVQKDTSETPGTHEQELAAAEKAEPTATRAVEPPASQTTAVAEKPGAYPELTHLLHAAISRHKRYPLTARRMRREGTAQLDFRLHADGRIDRLQIARSSGNRSLDEAASRAVAAINPFEPAAAFISQPRQFQVNVVFRLN